MIVIDDILISDEVIERKFICDLSKCKGACCKSGDFGAPVSESEIDILKELLPKIEHLLTDEAIAKIKAQGVHQSYTHEDKSFEGTTLLEDGSCVFLKENEIGMLECMIEKAHYAGISDFKKPISCHLYPLRVIENEEVNLTAVNYSEWDICSAACELGAKEDVPVYQFLKEALIRKFGEDFYEQLDGAFHHKFGNLEI
jgi:Fe-S-cluster containining protein